MTPWLRAIGAAAADARLRCRRVAGRPGRTSRRLPRQVRARRPRGTAPPTDPVPGVAFLRPAHAAGQYSRGPAASHGRIGLTLAPRRRAIVSAGPACVALVDRRGPVRARPQRRDGERVAGSVPGSGGEDPVSFRAARLDQHPGERGRPLHPDASHRRRTAGRPDVSVGAPIVQVDCHYRAAGGRDIAGERPLCAPDRHQPVERLLHRLHQSPAARRRPRPPGTRGTTATASTASSERRPGASRPSWTTSGSSRKDDVPRFEAMTKSDAGGRAALRPQLQARRQRQAGRPQVDLELRLRRADEESGVTSSGRHERLVRHHREPVRGRGGDDQQPLAPGLPPQSDEQGQDAVADDPRRRADRLPARLRLAPPRTRRRGRLERGRVPEGLDRNAAGLAPDSDPSARQRCRSAAIPTSTARAGSGRRSRPSSERQPDLFQRLAPKKSGVSAALSYS